MEIIAKHAIITDTCRNNKGDVGAINEALERIRQEYDNLLQYWPIGKGTKFHIKLIVEYEKTN